MSKEKKKLAKKVSETFHNIMKASVTANTKPLKKKKQKSI